MTIYYFDQTNGNDSAAGTSELAPWKSLSKMNAIAANAGGLLVAGDSVLLKRGETWPFTSTTALRIERSGSSGVPITWGAYGSGPKPTIDGGGVGRSCVTVVGDYPTFEDLILNDTVNPLGTGLEMSDATGTIANRVEVYAMGDQAFHGTGDSTITLNDCIADGSADDGISGHDTTVWTVNRCTFSNCLQGMQSIETVAITFNNCTFDSNTTSVNWGSGNTMVFNGCRFITGAVAGKYNNAEADGGTFNYCIWDCSAGVFNNNTLNNLSAVRATAINNCVFYGGNDGVKRGGIYTYNVAGSRIDLVNCILLNLYRTYQFASTQINADHCCIYGLTSKSLNSETNPITGPPLLDANLKPIRTSPCVNAGTDLGLTLDYAGRKVPNGVPDVGAYEYWPPSGLYMRRRRM